MTCPVTRGVGDPMVLADKMHFAGPVKTDARAVYFIEGGGFGTNGRLLKVAKP